MRTLVALTLAQAFAQTGAPIVILVGGIIGTAIAPEGLATLPIAMMIIGTAATTIPAALLMSRIGRKPGFLFAAAYASAAGWLAAYAVANSHFWLFCVATFLIGSHIAFVQQYRFAVAESVSPARVGPAISILMLAGVGAAYMGPEVGNQLHDWLEWGEFTGSFVGLSGLMMCAFVCLLFVPASVVNRVEADAAPRPLSLIAMQPLFILAVSAAVVGYAIMSFIMTATPVSMHTVEHFSLDDTTWVIQSHIVAMFLPSLFSGVLIARFGAIRIICVGLALMFGCVAIAWVDRSLMHYWWALVLLGIGWNFLFIGGTTLLTQTYVLAERFKVQALNDFLVFGCQAVAAVGSGLVLTNLGWYWILGVSVPFLAILIPILWFSGRSRPAPA